MRKNEEEEREKESGRSLVFKNSDSICSIATQGLGLTLGSKLRREETRGVGAKWRKQKSRMCVDSPV